MSNENQIRREILEDIKDILADNPENWPDEIRLNVNAYPREEHSEVPSLQLRYGERIVEK